LGWTSNFHAYALRRVLRNDKGSLSEYGKEEKGSYLATCLNKLDLFQKECWVGPNRSTSIDVFFQPLYVGGALADDRHVLLGDLVYAGNVNGEGVMDLQYVHDFGCWWSHSIRIDPSEPPPDRSVAYLLSGHSACPLEDTNGPTGWCETMARVLGLLSLEDETPVGPSHPLWWKLVHEELRGNSNSYGLKYPIGFNLEQCRLALKEGLCLKLEKPGTEHRKMTMQDLSSGLSGTESNAGTKPRVKKEVKNPTKVCAQCGVTAGLQICAGCDSIAFCCREHQLTFWPLHKVDCKKMQKQRKKK
jgi:hypothetical protein